jgi:hypothetical protein
VQPGTIWPSPGGPVYPTTGPVRPPTGSTQPLPGGGRPDNTLPGGQGGTIDNALPSQTFWALCYMPSLGWRFIAVDPSLRPGMPLPPHAQPKYRDLRCQRRRLDRTQTPIERGRNTGRSRPGQPSLHQD